MSTYETKEITRKDAQEKLSKIIAIQQLPKISLLSDTELEDMLDELACTEEYTDILGFLYNFKIK